MPFRKSRRLSPREQVADEARVGFAAAAVCLSGGAIGWLINAVSGWHTSLPALAVVGGFYGIMGLASWWKWRRMKPDDIRFETPGH